MDFLFIGDVVGKPGRDVVSYFLDELNNEYNIDFVIANLENATHGKGLNKEHFFQMLESGIDVVTLGNHYLAKREILDFIDDYDNLLRPINVHKTIPGHGSNVFQCGNLKIRVTNIMGRVYMGDNLSNPFDALQEIVDKDKSDIHIVDFHAEASGEKQALAYAFDGKINALFGTHTHVQTNDLRLLENGTLYITDVGMCGPYNGILGSSKEAVIKKTWTGVPTLFVVEEDNEYIFNAIYFSVDEKTLKITNYKNIYKVIKKEEVIDE